MICQNSKLKSQSLSRDQKNKTDLRNRSYAFSIRMIKFIATLPDIRLYWAFSDQLLRSGTSIGANIFKAKSSSSKKDFIKYYEIALKSANETKYWLGLLKDSLDFNQNETRELEKETDE